MLHHANSVDRCHKLLGYNKPPHDPGYKCKNCGYGYIKRTASKWCKVELCAGCYYELNPDADLTTRGQINREYYKSTCACGRNKFKYAKTCSWCYRHKTRVDNPTKSV